MDINVFQKLADDRVVILDKIQTKEKSWGPDKWALAVLGELGEFANLLKKVDRMDLTLEEALPDLRKECADVVTYAFALMSSLGGDMEDELIKKFNIVSLRWVDKANQKGMRDLRDILLQGLIKHPEEVYSPKQDETPFVSCINPECPIGCPDSHAEAYSPEDIIDMDELRSLSLPEDPLNPELGPEHREYWIRKVEQSTRSMLDSKVEQRANTAEDPKVS